MQLTLNIKKSLLTSVVLAVVFSLPMLLHTIEEEYYWIIYIPSEYIELLRVAVSLIYPLAAFKLGQGAASRARGSILGFTLGVVRASAETIFHPYYSMGSLIYTHGITLAYLGYIMVNQLGTVENFLLRNIGYILMGTFISSLGGLYGYLNRLSHPLKRSETGDVVYVFRDYWSNRQKFDKNRFPENPNLDFSKGDKPLNNVPPELFLRHNGEYVEVVDVYKNRVLASNLLNPQYLALRFEPIWNPIPLAVERKITKWVMPLSIGLSLLSVLLSFNNIYALLESAINNLRYFSLSNLLFFINSFGDVLFSSVFPVLLVFILSFILIVKVVHIRRLKPESSLTLLFLTLLMPVLTYGVSTVSKSAMTGNFFIIRVWLPILLISLGIIFFSALRIRDCENVSIYLYQNVLDDLAPFWYQQDKPVWAQGDFYWVFRYMYCWPMEVTIPRPHIDWERVEVWVNAQTGQAEWITTDYHWRELWYEVVGPVNKLYVDFDPNFHTPLPIIFNDELDYIQQVLFTKLSISNHIISQIKYIRRGKWYNLWVGVSFESQLRAAIKQMHPEALLMELTGSKIIASQLASLYWRNWRYPQGADRKEIYSATARNYPATIVFTS